jgi:hypothetical protein
LVQPPKLNRSGGQVPSGFQLTLSGPAEATLYYTLDGSDPRLAQGGISSSAVAYEGPVTIQGDATVVCRARNVNLRQTDGPPSSTPWSRPVRANYTISRK